MRDIEKVIQSIVNTFRAVRVQQLTVPHPGVDDDGIWFFRQPQSEFEVQIESPKGMCPFLIETDEHPKRITANSVDETIQKLTALLHLKPGV